MRSLSAGSVPTAGPTGTIGITDRRVLLGLVLGFCALTAVPTIRAAHSTPPSSRFTGLVAHPYDLTYYMASQRGAATGSARANRFTNETSAPGPISPMYPALGTVERALGLRPTSLFHLPQVVGAPILVLLVWWIAGLVHRDVSARRWAVVLSLFGAGAGALASGATGGRSADAAVFELSPTLSVATMPHFTVAYLGIVVVWGSIVSGAVGRGIVKTTTVGAVGGLLLGVSHGFLLLPSVAGCAVVGLVLAATRRRRQALAVSLAGAASLLAAGPFLLALSHQQAEFERLQGRSFPGRPADTWWTWATAMPILWILLAVAAVALVGSKVARQQTLWIPALWLAVQGSLVFLPVTVFQRRFSEGIVIPAALLAGSGAAWFLRDRSRLPRVTLCLLLALPSCSLAWLAGSRSLSVERDTDQLASSLTDGDVVLAGQALSWQLPAISGATTYLGRDVETLRYAEKQAAVERYLQDPSSPTSRSWFSQSGITAIAVDDRDASLDFQPPADGCFVGRALGSHIRLLRPAASCATGPA